MSHRLAEAGPLESRAAVLLQWRSRARSTAETAAVDAALPQVGARADELAAAHRDDTAGAAEALRRHMAAPYRPPTWLSKVWHAAVDWARDHAELLDKIATGLSMVAMVLGVLSMIPGLNLALLPLTLITIAPIMDTIAQVTGARSPADGQPVGQRRKLTQDRDGVGPR